MNELESDPRQSKRLILWVASCLAIMIGWSYIAPQPVAPPAERAIAPSAPDPAAPVAPAAPAISGAEDAAVEMAAPVPPEAIAEATPRRVQATTDRFDVELSNVGGRITSWKLLDEGDYAVPTEPLELVRRRLPPSPASEPPVAGAQLRASDSQDLLPLQVVTGDAALDEKLRQARHVVSSESVPGARILRARWSDGAGTLIEKTVTLREDVPLATVEARLLVNNEAVAFRLAWGPGIANHRPEDRSNIYFQRGAVTYLVGEDVETIARPDKQDTFPDASVHWAALQDSYFAVVFTPVPLAGSDARPGMARGFSVGGALQPDEKGKLDKRSWPDELVLQVPFTPDAPAQSLYIGPRDRRALRALESSFVSAPGLPMLTHLGMLDGLGRLLHVPLLRFHQWTGSWGLAIFLLTLMVRIVIAPMQLFSMKKMRRMQDKMAPMQAKLKELDQRYKKLPPSRENKMKLMQEKQQLMLQAGINPADTLSGCLPMLITMPVFFALLKLLPNAPEFRHEAFLFWADLGAADPTRLMPIAAAVLTLISTKMSMASSAASMDPMQRNMMIYMFPLMLVWFCWSAPLAFVVYQVAMSLVQIVQQRIFDLTMPPTAGVPSSPPARPGKPRGAPVVETAVAASGPSPAAAARSHKKGRKR